MTHPLRRTIVGTQPSAAHRSPTHRAVVRATAGIAAALSLVVAGSSLAAQPAPKHHKNAVAQHIATFDELDFDVFTHQKWDRLSESHSPDILVHWPDGHETRGIERHIADLKAMFVYAPDTRISEHPVKFGQGPWTSVIGTLEGTFTQPMPVGDGKFIQPTGRAFKLRMVTIGHWKGSTMDEEYLFWDNATFMKQLGLSQ